MEVWDKDASPSWLLQWCDSRGISSADKLQTSLGRETERKSLRDAMEVVRFTSPAVDTTATAPIAAGGSLDLSGTLGCCHYECLRDQVDTLFQRVLHYFDRIYVVGPPASRLAEDYDLDDLSALSQVDHYARLLFHLRDIGAEEYLSFGEKPAYCTEHGEKHAKEVGLSEVYSAKNHWIEEIDRDAKVSYVWDLGAYSWNITVEHPSLEVPFRSYLHPSDAANPGIRKAALSALFDVYAAQLVADVQYSRDCDAALGTAVSIHEDLLIAPRHAVEPSEFAVAFNLPLPFIDGLTAKEIIAIRENEHESFNVFREKIRQAITARLDATRDEADSTTIAIEIAQDVIAPALFEIENKMKNARDALRRGSGFLLGAGSVATTIGLLGAMPMVGGALIGALMAAPDLRNYYTAKRQVQNSDLYYMWRLMDRGRGH